MRSYFSLNYCSTEVRHTRRHQSVLCVSKCCSSSNGLRKPSKKQTRKTATRVVILCPVRSSCCLLSKWYQLYCFQYITADVFCFCFGISCYSPNFRLEKNRFLSCLLYCHWRPPPSSRSGGHAAWPLARSTSFFTVTINCYFTFRYRRWELRLGIAPERELRGGPELRSSTVRWRVWFLAEIPSVQYPGYCRKSRV